MRFSSVMMGVVAAMVFLIMNCADPYEDCDMSELQQCHENQMLDSLEIASALVGKWKWKYALNCVWATSKQDLRDARTFAGTSVEFLANGEFVVYEPNDTSHHQWSLDSLAYDGWQIIDPTKAYGPPHETLHGRIRMCGEWLLANNSYIDGGDNLFMRE